MNFLQSKNGMERASFDAVWPHLPCLLRLKNLFQFLNLRCLNAIEMPVCFVL